MNPNEYCREKAAASGSSFYYSFRVLKPATRDAIIAFYALCRELDDVVDECSDANVARLKLAWWSDEIGNLYQGMPRHPVTQALHESMTSRVISREWLEEIIDGMEMDLDQHRYPDYKTLLLYCHRAAGVVGQAAAAIFGYRNHETLKYAHELGLAFQLTNIIRDVGDDARRGRIYIPMSELQQFDVKASEILQRQPPWGYSDRFLALMQFQAERAHRSYDEALQVLPEADRVAQKPGLMMANIYRSLLREIEADGFRVLHQRTSLTPLRKLWIAARTQWRGA